MTKTKAKDVKLTKAGKPRKKPGRKPTKKLYFGPEVQDAIVRYNQSESDAEKNKIYAEEIHKAFDKLCENIINTFKFTYFDDGFEDVKHEVVTFLVMNIHKYDHTKGSKAFSYFSIVAKNYLILHNNNNYKKYKTHDGIEAMDSAKNAEKNNHQKVDLTEFVDDMVVYFEHLIPKLFKKKRDIDIAFSIVELMRRTDEIENFNKKSLYLLIREMTGVNTSHITKVANIMKKHYTNLYKEYLTTGYVNNKKHINSTFF
jgi:hypothetical protein